MNCQLHALPEYEPARRPNSFALDQADRHDQAELQGAGHHGPRRRPGHPAVAGKPDHPHPLDLHGGGGLRVAESCRVGRYGTDRDGVVDPTAMARSPQVWPEAHAPEWNESGPLREHLTWLLTMVIEVLDGRRAAHQLRTILQPTAYESLATRCRMPAAGRHRLRSLHTCRPCGTAIELCATVEVAATPPRVIALAARLDLTAGRWRCTVLRPLHPGQLAAAHAPVA